MNDRFESHQASAPAQLKNLHQVVAQGDLQYVSLQIDGKTYGGWYRVLSDGRMELLALSNVHCEHRSERTPIEQARGMLADFVRATQSVSQGRYPMACVAKHAADLEQDSCDISTLGDLLYADRSKVRVDESEWHALLEAIALGDSGALYRLFDRTQHLVFTLMFRRVGDPERAEELTLDVFRSVWRRAAEFDAATDTVLGWVMNIARELSVPSTRAQGATNDSRVSTVREGFRAEGERFRRALFALTNDERRALKRAYFSQCNADATETGASSSAATAQIHSGLTKLRYSLSSGNSR